MQYTFSWYRLPHQIIAITSLLVPLQHICPADIPSFPLQDRKINVTSQRTNCIPSQELKPRKNTPGGKGKRERGSEGGVQREGDREGGTN